MEQNTIGNDIWDVLSILTGWPRRRDKEGHVVDRKEMKRVEELRYDFIRERKFDYRCSVCKGKLEVVEFVYGNVTVVKVKPCKECSTLSTIEAYGRGYDKGYEFGQEDK